MGDRKGMQKFWHFINSSVYLHEELYCGYFPEFKFVPKIYTGMAAVGSSLTPGGRVFLWETSGIDLHIVFSFQSLNLRILVKYFGQE